MGGDRREACGRCAMSTVVDAVEDEESASDPFGGERIELSASELRAASPAAWLAGVKRRADELATRLTYKSGR